MVNLLMNNVFFKIISHGTPEYQALVVLREDILLKPLGLSFSIDVLEKEKGHIHIAGFKRNEIVATIALAPKGEKCKMKRVVVRTDMQYSGLGSKMIVFFEKYAKAQGFKSIYCHARDSAVHFYLKHNYVAEGDYFDIDTVKHLLMRKVI